MERRTFFSGLLKVQPTSGQEQFFPRIEALRGLSALVVAADHAWQSPWRDASGITLSFIPSTAEGVYGGWTTTILSVFGNGLAAVDVFFVISGFVLLQSLMRAGDCSWANVFRFIVARLFRIFPAAVVTIGIFVLVFCATGSSLSGPGVYEPLIVLRNALLIDSSITGVMWTLRIEVIAIPLLILGFVLYRSFGIVGLTVLLSTLIGLAATSIWTHLIDTPFGLGVLQFFGVGMLVFGVGVQPWMRRSHIATLVLVVAIALTLSAWSLPRFGVRAHHIEMACDAVIVGLLAFGSLGALGKFFDHPVVRFYGRISYSFYLLNALTLLLFWHIPEVLGRVMQTQIPGAVVALGMFAISVLVTTPAAWLMYKYVERPGILAGRMLLDNLRLTVLRIGSANAARGR